MLTKLRDLDAELRLIVLTHFHYDHVGAADAIRSATGARVAIRKNDAEALRLGGKLKLIPTRLWARILALFITKKDQAPVTPDLELDDTEDLTRTLYVAHYGKVEPRSLQSLASQQRS